nr:uncharacterized protein LOC127315767 [Lolium perenne]
MEHQNLCESQLAGSCLAAPGASRGHLLLASVDEETSCRAPTSAEPRPYPLPRALLLFPFFSASAPTLARRPSLAPAATGLPKPSRRRHPLRLVATTLPVEGIDAGCPESAPPLPSSSRPAAEIGSTPALRASSALTDELYGSRAGSCLAAPGASRGHLLLASVDEETSCRAPASAEPRPYPLPRALLLFPFFSASAPTLARRPSLAPAATGLPKPSRRRHPLRLVATTLPVEGIDAGCPESAPPLPSSSRPAAENWLDAGATSLLGPHR